MDKSDFVKIVAEKYPIQENVCYKSNAVHISSEGTSCIMQGYVVDDYFVDAKTLQVFNKSYFNMTNNIEDDENV